MILSPICLTRCAVRMHVILTLIRRRRPTPGPAVSLHPKPTARRRLQCSYLVARPTARLGLSGAAIVGILLYGCGEPEDPGEATHVVVTQEERWPSGYEWRVAPEPIVELGSASGAPDFEFYRIATALMLGDGRIAVGERSSQRIRVFDPDGRRLLLTLGGQGRGPGEFTGLSWFGLFSGDSIFAWDSDQFRGTVFGPDGQYVRTVAIENTTGLPIIFPDLVFPDGSILVRAGPPKIQTDSTGESWGYEYFGVYGKDGKHISTIGMLPVDRCTNTSGLPCRTMVFGPRARWAAGDGRLYFGTSVDYLIRGLNLDGSTAFAFRRAFSARNVTDEDVRVLDSGGSSARAPEERAVAAIMPAFDRILTDLQGQVWVRNYRSHTWSVFSSSGKFRGSVAMPQGLHVHQIGHDYVLGVTRDSLDVERVVVHRLFKPLEEG